MFGIRNEVAVIYYFAGGKRTVFEDDNINSWTRISWRVEDRDNRSGQVTFCGKVISALM